MRDRSSTGFYNENIQKLEQNVVQRIGNRR